VIRQDLGMIENWLRAIRDVYRLHGKITIVWS